MEEINLQSVLLRKLTLGSFENNVYILIDPDAKESAIIDAAAEADRILEAVRGTRVRFILQTHCHMDHVMALEEVKSATGAPVGIHAADEKAFGVRADFRLEDNQILDIGKGQIRVIHTPGHTPGGVCFLIDHHLLSGDTLFEGGPGKTASPESFQQIVESITQKLFRLSDSTICYTGHGPNTTIGKAKKEYQIFARKKRTKPAYGDVVWLTS
ncbi:MAG: MBL fold metallo-hydrolase [Proteobacteria bacterium]|nr:MBL fold metallo-hydrolase [Pseudomonadota bacterium]